MALNTDTFKSYPDLASSANGGKILFATDDFFAVAENMLNPAEPIWDPNSYTPEGKEMDGWETRRKRILGHDWCILKLGLSGSIVGVDADTAWFTGNNVPAFSIQAACLNEDLKIERVSKRGSKASDALLKEVEKIKSDKWTTILKSSPLKSGVPETRHNVFKVDSSERWTHLRINLYPDGGLSRLRVFGNVIPDWSKIPDGLIDIASLVYGGKALSWSNAHYGSPMRLLAPNRSTGMHDGWETARNPNRPPIFKLGPDGMIEMKGNEWTIIQLGRAATIDHIIVDTNHYKGNFPESCVIEQKSGPSADKGEWKPLLKRQLLGPHKEHTFKEIEDNHDVSFLRVTMYPDGGISRVRVLAKVNTTALPAKRQRTA
ncbi:allantoicase-like protein [Globomyces pollinis-pini]|nr:allantoicase-like protein [Globomyces pollinis-pini]